MAKVCVFWDIGTLLLEVRLLRNSTGWASLDAFPPFFHSPMQVMETLACEYGSLDSIQAYTEDAQMSPRLSEGINKSISVIDCSKGTSKGNKITGK